MTVSFSDRQSSQYPGPEAANASYYFTFPLNDSTMLEVVKRTNGGDPVVVDPANYTVSLNQNQIDSSGGTVVYTPALLATETLQIRSNLTIQQSSDLTISNTYNPKNIENALDYLAMCIQDLARKAGL